jgi:hypothetical protein
MSRCVRLFFCLSQQLSHVAGPAMPSTAKPFAF